MNHDQNVSMLQKPVNNSSFVIAKIDKEREEDTESEVKINHTIADFDVEQECNISNFKYEQKLKEVHKLKEFAITVPAGSKIDTLDIGKFDRKWCKSNWAIAKSKGIEPIGNPTNLIDRLHSIFVKRVVGTYGKDAATSIYYLRQFEYKHFESFVSLSVHLNEVRDKC